MGWRGYFTKWLRNANIQQSYFPLLSVFWCSPDNLVPTRPHFRRDSSCTWQPCCRNPRTRGRCTGSRRCETSGTWIPPSTHSTVCTDGWTRSRQSRPPCTCFLKWGQKRKKERPGRATVSHGCSNCFIKTSAFCFWRNCPQRSHFPDRAEMFFLQRGVAICFGELRKLTAWPTFINASEILITNGFSVEVCQLTKLGKKK